MGESTRGTVTYPLSSDELPSEAVLKAISIATDRSVLEMDPLYDAVDPDALDVVLRDRNADDRRPRVSFIYAGCRVNVESGKIHVERLGNGCGS